MAEIRHASPLRQHWIGVVPARVRSDAVSVEEMPFLGRVLLQGDGRDRTVIDAVGKALGFPLPRMPNTSAHKDSLCLWLSPSSWLFVTEDAGRETLVEQLMAAIKDLDAAITDLSDSRTTLRLGGPRLRDVLAKGCALDLGAKAFEPRTVVRTLVADVPVILYHEETGAYIDAHVGAFDADYLWTWLIEAGRDFTSA
jgi:sarcosine oxidase subunit gamma